VIATPFSKLSQASYGEKGGGKKRGVRNGPGKKDSVPEHYLCLRPPKKKKRKKEVIWKKKKGKKGEMVHNSHISETGRKKKGGGRYQGGKKGLRSRGERGRRRLRSEKGKEFF